ncbi:MAG: CotH kinase family protein [Reichenbachiella sp.]|uniref:CotH kinase family protein n=1 Tax=Reichenbachiella sp. TaxID=2184521 RepID=UPI00329A71E7
MTTFTTKLFASVCLIFLGLFSCQQEIFEEDVESGFGLDDWTTETHSEYGEPNYEVVFAQDKVHRIDIVLTTDEFTTMQNDLAQFVGFRPPGTSVEGKPIYVAADFYYEGTQWYEVGIRYKGNSSLQFASRDGINKLPLRFEFDKFEDEYPEIKNQRFYGFEEVSMSSGYLDQSCMREKTAADLFREFGVPAAQTAYYEIWVDEGDGNPKYYGLYTMVEIIFDTMLQNMFGSSSGNCYKPEGEGARFGVTGFDLNHFEKKTNEDEGDWSDIQALYDALHASTRSTNVEKWKADLEALFDVDGFLKYLAVNNTIQNWDTYGLMDHNYYLYHDPADDLIKWIPWDNNMAFADDLGKGALSFEMSEVGDDWPLISYIIAVPEYRDKYDAYINDFINGPFESTKMQAQYEDMSTLIEQSATSEVSGYSFLNNPGDFYSDVLELQTYVSQRKTDSEAYLH